MIELLPTHRVNHSPLFKKLRQLLVLFTLLLVPQLAGAADYDLWIGGVRVTDANKGGITGDSIILGSSGSVTFDPDYNTLTLNNVTFYNCITSGLDNLIIKLNGTSNKVNTNAGVNGNDVAITSTINTAKLTIEREANATTELELKANSNNSVITNFASISYGTGNKQTYLSSNEPIAYDTQNKYLRSYWTGSGQWPERAIITSNVTYPIWIGGHQITRAALGNEANDKYRYDETNNTLILNNFQRDQVDGNAIYSDVESLKVKLVNDNLIECTLHSFYSIYNGDATISFTTDPASPGTLNLTNASGGYNVIEGFKNDTKPTVNNGLAWLPSIYNGITYSATIKTVSVLVAGYAPAADGSITGTRIEAGTVTFAPATATTPNTLTLNGATVWGQIFSNVGDLTIQFIGANNVSTYDTETHVITSANNGTLTIKTDATIDNKLYLRESSSRCSGAVAGG